MPAIEVQKNIKIELEDLVKGFSKMDTISLERISVELNQMIARRKTQTPSKRELTLLKKIYAPFSLVAQKRYDLLYTKLQEENISDKEHKELLELVEKSEQHNAKWLEYLVELSQLRGQNLLETKRQLNLEKPPIA